MRQLDWPAVSLALVACSPLLMGSAAAVTSFFSRRYARQLSLLSIAACPFAFAAFACSGGPQQGVRFVGGILIVQSLPALLTLWDGVRRSRPRSDDALRCEYCGYYLTGLVEPRCPECGSAFSKELLQPAPGLKQRTGTIEWEQAHLASQLERQSWVSTSGSSHSQSA